VLSSVEVTGLTILRDTESAVQTADSAAASESVMLLVTAGILLALLFHKSFDPFYYFSTDNAEIYFAWLIMLSRALQRGDW